MMSPKTKKKVLSVKDYVIRLAVGLLFVSPLIIGLFFSVQTEDTLMTYPLRLITKNPTLENYAIVFQKVPLLTYLKNSVIVCVVSILGQIVFASLCAYGFVFFEFPGKKLLWTLVLSTMMIPGEVVVITNYVTIQNLGLMNTYVALIITHLIGGTSIFMMRQYYMQLPKDFKEAATLDGCGELGFLFRIATPLSIPTISSLAIYMFVQIYNGFFWPLLVTSKNEMRTVQIGISFLVTSDIVNYGQILAGAMVAIIPSTIAYIFGQDYIIKGMTSGGVKG